MLTRLRPTGHKRQASAALRPVAYALALDEIASRWCGVTEVATLGRQLSGRLASNPLTTLAWSAGPVLAAGRACRSAMLAPLLPPRPVRVVVVVAVVVVVCGLAMCFGLW